MKYTDKLFRFPVKVYSPSSIEELLKAHQKRAQDMERREMIGLGEDEEDINEEPDWAAGELLMKYEEIVGIEDYMPMEQSAKDAHKNGFRFTSVETERWGPVVCLWSKTKFLAALDAHVESLGITKVKGATSDIY